MLIIKVGTCRLGTSLAKSSGNFPAPTRNHHQVNTLNSKKLESNQAVRRLPSICEPIKLQPLCRRQPLAALHTASTALCWINPPLLTPPDSSGEYIHNPCHQPQRLTSVNTLITHEVSVPLSFSFLFPN